MIDLKKFWMVFEASEIIKNVNFDFWCILQFFHFSFSQMKTFENELKQF